MNFQYINSYSRWLEQFPFEIMLTVRLQPTMPLQDIASAYVQEILTPLSLLVGEKVGGITVVVPETKDHKMHMHSLMLSETEGRLSQSINTIRSHFKNVLKKGFLVTHEKSLVVDVVDPLKIKCRYFAKHLSEDMARVKFYKERLLKYRCINQIQKGETYEKQEL